MCPRLVMVPSCGRTEEEDIFGGREDTFNKCFMKQKRIWQS